MQKQDEHIPATPHRNHEGEGECEILSSSLKQRKFCGGAPFLNEQQVVVSRAINSINDHYDSIVRHQTVGSAVQEHSFPVRAAQYCTVEERCTQCGLILCFSL
jgi:hypothetical protein